MKVIAVLLSVAVLMAVHPALPHAETLQLEYSTYLGGSANDEEYGITLGTGGEAYLTGDTVSSDF
ncbi:MAG: hypothetical protein NTV79_00400, partial [Candidatus Aureabacteria bacterium]|nr:hypothetical protein [Candidatus Auribacterota bacterium]